MASYPLSIAREETWLEGGSLKPIALDDPTQVFVVRRGHFDVFATSRETLAGRRHHLFRVEPEGLLLGIEAVVHAYGLIAVGSIDSALENIGLHCPPASSAAEGWILHLSRAAAEPLGNWPDRIAAESKLTLAAGERLAGDPYRIHWVEVQAGAVHLLGHVPVALGQPFPLAAPAWLTASDEAALTVTTFGDCEPSALQLFNNAAIDAIALRIERRAEDEQRISELTQSASGQDFEGAMGELAGSASRRRNYALRNASAAPLEAALIELLSALHVPNEDLSLARILLTGAQAQIEPGQSLDHVLNRLRIGRRRVMLQQDFWNTEGPPMLAWLGEDRTPVALVYRRGHGWQITDTQGSRRLDPASASDLAQDAVHLYASMSAKPLSFSSLFTFGGIGLKPDFIHLAIASLMISVLALTVPIGSHFLIDTVIPDGQISMLWIIVSALIVAALSGAAFGLVKAVAMLRAESQFETRLQPALFERLMRLPTSFYRAHTVGDIGDRIMGIQSARQILSGSVIGAVLSGIFGLVSLVPLFFYDSRLALVGVGLSIVMALTMTGLSYGQLRHERERMRHQGKLDGFVVQMLIGIAKLRAAAAEPRAMTQWTAYFVAQRNRFISAQNWIAAQMVVQSFLPTLSSVVLYGMMAYWLRSDLAKAASGQGSGAPPLSAADFVAFVSAFGQVMAALTGMATALTAMLKAVPLIERSEPLIGTEIEVPRDAEPPGVLTGDVEFKHVKFRYIADGPLVLDDLSIRVEPGQFIAIVGPSGSGKSTIARLMLGFERPELGEILFGGKSSNRIDMGALRRQVGVVLQHGRISSGSVYDNIVGDAQLSLDEAWNVARLVGLDQDIRDMPMGMHTGLLDGGATLSGGQRQRILIARALVRKPRILLLDEATSALDNRTQGIVTDTLGKLSITRIVIAHRLSTIQSVDRILVMERGCLIETGTYDELINKNGAFATLANRQLL